MGQLNQCPGSYQPPERIVTEGSPRRDRWGYRIGSTGTGLCGTCQRTIGLMSHGTLARHVRPAEQEG